jgi:hypothetical protein
MNKSLDTLCNVCPYHGSSQIQVANGSHLVINKIGDQSFIQRCLCISWTVLIILFWLASYLRKTMMSIFLVMVVLCKIRCWGRYSQRDLKLANPFHSNSLFLVVYLWFVWHKRLCHPNSVVLSCMLNSGLLGNKEHVSIHLVI